MTLYAPQHFRVDDADALYRFVEAHAFGILVSSGSAGLHVSHIPFLPERDAGGRVRLLCHLARANPQSLSLEAATDLLAIFQGPHAYVSPGWYQQHPAVPTWNYSVVHAHGRARALDEAQLHDHVIRLSNAYESGRPRPWHAADLPGPFVSPLLGTIAGFAIEVERLEGKFKLSQNRPAEIPRVIEALEREGEAGLAALMRNPPPKARG
jgi:transcriptional regulator